MQTVLWSNLIPGFTVVALDDGLVRSREVVEEDAPFLRTPTSSNSKHLDRRPRKLSYAYSFERQDLMDDLATLAEVSVHPEKLLSKPELQRAVLPGLWLQPTKTRCCRSRAAMPDNPRALPSELGTDLIR